MKNMYLLGVLLLLLCSCSSADKVLSEKAEKTISMLENLQKENRISDVTFQEARENVIQYDYKSFFGKYWFGAVFIAYVIITLVATNVESEENLDRAKPLSKWKVYLVWLYSGLWGGHIFFYGINTIIRWLLFGNGSLYNGSFGVYIQLYGNHVFLRYSKSVLFLYAHLELVNA